MKRFILLLCALLAFQIFSIKTRCVVFDYGSVIGKTDYTPMIAYLKSTLTDNLSDARDCHAEWVNTIKIHQSEEGFWEKQFQYYRQEEPDQKWFDGLEKAREESFKRVAGMDDLVDDLKAKGYKVALLSNIAPLKGSFLKKHGRYDKFDPAILSCDVNVKKPHPSIYHHLLKRVKLRAQECFFVDNRKTNTDMAKAMGFDVHTFTTKEHLMEDLHKAGVI